MEGASPAGTARTGMIAPSACKAPSGFDRISRYQRPRVPRTERTNTSPPSTTTQMITRCDGAAGSGRVSISTSSTAGRRSSTAGAKIARPHPSLRPAERDGRRGPGEVAGVGPYLGQLGKVGSIADDDEGPVLAVLRAARAPAGVEDAAQVVGLQGAGSEAAHDAQGIDGLPSLHGPSLLQLGGPPGCPLPRADVSSTGAGPHIPGRGAI